MHTTDNIIQFLLNNLSLGEKTQDSPARYIFPKKNLPSEIQSVMPPTDAALLLVERFDGSWYIHE